MASMADMKIAKRLAELPGAIVPISCGKDATACLDLFRTHAPQSRCVGVFWYMVKGLSFQERYLDYLSRRYGVEILRLPHFFVSMYRATGAYCLPSSCKIVTQADMLAYVREVTGLDWIILGEKCCDQPDRLWRIRACKGWDEKSRKAYPVGFWTHNQVLSYLKRQRVALPPDYRDGQTTSFGGFVASELRTIKERYPDDWQKIKDAFPLVDACLVRADIVQASGVYGGDGASVAVEERAVQSASD